MPSRNAVPPYLRMTADLRRRIESGELAPGEQLDSIDRLASHYGVSRATSQRAINELVKLGLVTTRRRWGTFVADRG